VLTELRVRDVAVIADVTLPLAPGLNVLSGETGAGKSLLVDALALLLGERATGTVVRAGARRAVVEAAFDTADVDGIEAVADRLGIDLDDDRLVIRREINPEGRNRAWANGSPTTVSALADLGMMLVDLHGQHEAQSLLRPAAQRDILDAFGDADRERERVAAAYRDAAALRSKQQELTEHRAEVRRRADYLRHVSKEIVGANVELGEDESLDVEAKRLGNVEGLARLTEQAVASLADGEDRSVLETLGQVDRWLAALRRIDDTTAPWADLLAAARTHVEERAVAVREYASELEADPARLATVEARRDLLYRLMQKYGPTLEDVRRAGADAEQELELLDTADFDLERLAERLNEAEEVLAKAADALSAKRKRAAKRLGKAVEGLLPGLGMPEGRFTVTVATAQHVNADGADAVTFVVQLNPGLDARPLADVASGGELSRLMLALKVVLAGHDAIPSLVFDEVDQGIGGEVAVKVADALRAVAERRQVLVITHLPQIASRAARHVTIAKRPKGGVATADVAMLDGAARVREIARMLGDGDDPVALRHAEELLKGRTVGVER
jgi:DNA repair protein RecN (Recombination protein N)